MALSEDYLIEISRPWRLPLGEFFVLTSFDTLIYYCSKTMKLRHGEVNCAPRNLTVSRLGDRGFIKIKKSDEQGEQNAFVSESIKSILIKNAGIGETIAFQRDGLFMSAKPSGATEFIAVELMLWEALRLVPPKYLDSGRYWRPATPQGGTELMVAHLLHELGDEVHRIKLWVNRANFTEFESRKHVVWMHNDPGNPVYSWCRDVTEVKKIAKFVFVSRWQKEEFIKTFDLPNDRCIVIHNAIEMDYSRRVWPVGEQWRWRCAYTSAPFRGLSILLDAWQELSPPNAELHVWSGTALWGRDDSEFRPLHALALSIPNVYFHRVAPNNQIRSALRDMHFLVYPCIHDETFCLSMVEAMSTGCRVIAAARAAIPEIASGFAKLYFAPDDREQHRQAFMSALKSELANPWDGMPEVAENQQEFCRSAYNWESRIKDWRQVISDVCERP